MQPVDSLAAQALVALETDDPRISTDSRLRSAWSRFIISLLMRTPDDITALKGAVGEEFMRSAPELERAYAASKGPDDPASFAEYFDKHRADELDQWAMSLVPVVVDHKGIGELLNNMRWLVRRITWDGDELLTSDQPIVMSATLAESEAYVFLPIGPRAYFVAVNNIATQERVLARDGREQVNSINELVTCYARRLVYARSGGFMKFVARRMATKHRKTLLERLLERRRNGEDGR